MKKEVIVIPGIQTPDATFNHVVRAGDFLFLTSQLSADLTTGKILGGDIVAQTRQAMENVRRLLAACGVTMDGIVRVVVYLRDVKDRHQVNQVYREYFMKGQEPAEVTVQAPSPIEGIDIEIEVTAVLPRCIWNTRNPLSFSHIYGGTFLEKGSIYICWYLGLKSLEGFPLDIHVLVRWMVVMK
ncbi:MAG: RidA family protein [Chloroflexota bacterium]